MESASPFHQGERAVQKRLGVEEVDRWARQVVRDYLPEQHREFHTAQSFLVAAARDEEGRPWATLLHGREGFVTSPDERTLKIEIANQPGDALEHALASETELGLLGIELATRRRNRVNGRIRREKGSIVFEVDQTFGNCPQYIHARDWERIEFDRPTSSARSAELSPSQASWIRSADTFFIATGYRGEGEHPGYGMDASHRGGRPGFVEVEGERTLVFPDYSGNNHFNTIGNLECDSAIGLLFLDFDSGGLLQLTGHAEIVWDGPEVEARSGAERIVRVRIDEIVELRDAVPLRFSTPRDAKRTLRLVDKQQESEDVTSFYFEAEDQQPLPTFKPGQHLPIRLPIEGLEEKVDRTYSLSNPPNDHAYRISVKREAAGLASRALHDTIEIGATLESSRPSGDFVLGDDDIPVVLVSAGIGVTPLLSMLSDLASKAKAGSDTPPVTWIHGARDGQHHPFRREVEASGMALPRFDQTVAYSWPRETDRPGIDFDHRGRIDREMLAPIVQAGRAVFYLCGPPESLADLQRTLGDLGVPERHIRSESFG